MDGWVSRLLAVLGGRGGARGSKDGSVSRVAQPSASGARLPERGQLSEFICGQRDCCGCVLQCRLNAKQGPCHALGTGSGACTPASSGDPGGWGETIWGTGGLLEEEKQSRGGSCQRRRGLCGRGQAARGTQPGCLLARGCTLDDGPCPVLPKV